MSRLNFFCNVDTLNLLMGMDFPEDHPTVDISVDLIELPLWFTFTADEKNWTVKIMERGEVHAYDESQGASLGTLTVDRKTGEGSASVSDEMLAENAVIFFQAFRSLSCYAQENQLAEKFGDPDPESSGVLLGEDGDALTCAVVSGNDRPELMCALLLGGTAMTRPYMDDFLVRSAAELIPLDEKIKAAQAGDEDMMQALARAYLEGDGEVEPDPEKAVYWFEKLAEAGRPEAQFNLGLHYAKGYGVSRDFEKAARWMRKAAANGDDHAASLAVDYEKAAAAMKTPDDPQAQADLARVLMSLARSLEPAGPGDDYAAAFDLAQKSAAQDNGDGIWVLALCYEHGRGVAQDEQAAIELYKRGAELGHAPSQHSLACCYFQGDVLDPDYEKGFDLCMRSAQQGYGLAMRDLGQCYQFGYGVTGNMKTALEWYEKALEVIDDPELEEKVAMFKEVCEEDEDWGEDFT